MRFFWGCCWAKNCSIVFTLLLFFMSTYEWWWGYSHPTHSCFINSSYSITMIMSNNFVPFALLRRYYLISFILCCEPKKPGCLWLDAFLENIRWWGSNLHFHQRLVALCVWYVFAKVFWEQNSLVLVRGANLWVVSGCLSTLLGQYLIHYSYLGDDYNLGNVRRKINELD